MKSKKKIVTIEFSRELAIAVQNAERSRYQQAQMEQDRYYNEKSSKKKHRRRRSPNEDDGCILS